MAENDFTTWHEHRPIIDDALSVYKKTPTAVNRQAVYDRIHDALDQPWVKSKNGGKLLVQCNELDKAYSCMDQADMGVILLRCARDLPDTTLVDKAVACMDVNVTKVADGGLRTVDDDGSWFHGMTSRDNAGLGATFNKHLHCVRSLADGARVLNEMGTKPDKADKWRKIGKQGVNQLENGHYPSLKHFYVGGGQPELETWAYYALNYESKNGRFLDSNKNGGYHLYIMRLLSSLEERYGTLNWDGIPLKPLLKTYNAKLHGDGLYVDSDPCTDGDWRAVKENEAPLEQDVIAWFEAHI